MPLRSASWIDWVILLLALLVLAVLIGLVLGIVLGVMIGQQVSPLLLGGLLFCVGGGLLVWPFLALPAEMDEYDVYDVCMTCRPTSSKSVEPLSKCPFAYALLYWLPRFLLLVKRP